MTGSAQSGPHAGAGEEGWVHCAPGPWGGSATGLITCPWRGSGLLQRSCRPRCQSRLVQLQEETERSQEPHLLPSLQLNCKALPTHAVSSRLEPAAQALHTHIVSLCRRVLPRTPHPAPPILATCCKTHWASGLRGGSRSRSAGWREAVLHGQTRPGPTPTWTPGPGWHLWPGQHSPPAGVAGPGPPWRPLCRVDPLPGAPG